MAFDTTPTTPDVDPYLIYMEGRLAAERQRYEAKVQARYSIKSGVSVAGHQHQPAKVAESTRHAHR